MTPGRPEVADPAALPRVLADPPWLGERVRVTLPEITGLDPLPLPDREVWPDGLRRRLLSSGPGTSGSEGPGSLQDALAQLVDSPHGSAPKLAAAQRRIREAAADGDGAAVAAGLADLRRVEQQLSDSPRTLDAAAIVRLPGGIGADVWNALAWELIDDLDRPGFAAATLGLAGLAGITRVLQRRPAEYAGLALPFASVSLAPVVARCLRRVPPARRAARDWLLAHPEHAAAGLVGAALGFASDSQADALAGLRVLAEAGDRALVEQVGARYGRDDVTAGLTAVLDLDPLLELPSRIEPLPHWWAPGEWARPRLVDGRALLDQALDALGVMFALPREHGVYPGIGQAVAACDPASLAACGWDLFTAWLDDGADPQDGWAMSTLGLIGDDDTARRITPLLRSWTGRTQPRAVQGLDVLARIGTDVALLQLNGIAQRARSAGLKEAAGERIALLAAARQLTAQELQDRLVPDLGLDERGTLILDFGPRRFTVGFDEALTPLVRDQDGARLKTLPKPRSGDDPALAKEAAASWRRLKKDARTVAAQQVVRFERAMTQRQRWTPQEFTELIVGHPLVGHVAHRLVWGLYSPGAEGRWRGGELVAKIFITVARHCDDAIAARNFPA